MLHATNGSAGRPIQKVLYMLIVDKFCFYCNITPDHASKMATEEAL